MSLTRRSFVRTVAGGAAGLGMLPTSLLGEATARHGARQRRILVLGGTNYIGPHLVQHALERGHAVTTFTRGRRQPALYADLFERVEQLHGDRNGDLESLRSGTWDVVIDNSATNPQWVKDSATLLHGRVRRYLFVSSTGVFLPYLRPDIDESVEPRLDDPPGTEQPSFGVQKARAEREAVAAFGDAAIIVRPHFIAGQGDSSDRFPYWPVRLARGGEVFVPGRRTDAVQFIDVRDLVEFMIGLIENDEVGVYNVAGPRSTLTMERFVRGAAAALAADAAWVWADDYAFLRENEVDAAVPWIRLDGENRYMTSITFDRAVGKGLRFRPMETTVRDTLAWWRSPAVSDERRQSPRFVFSPERERELLERWKAWRR